MKKPAVLPPLLLAATAAALLTCLTYLPALQNDFVNWDDDRYVYENPFIRSLDVRLLRAAFLHFHASNWHPLTWISHALDVALWGLNPFGHHLTSVLLHGINTFLVVLLTAKLLEGFRQATARGGSPPPGAGGGAPVVAAAATGLLFGLHPLHVESVAWVSERKDLLCACFFLLSLLAYTKHLATRTSAAPPEAGTPGRGLPGRAYALALGAFCLALLSKPMAVTLPLVLLLLDWFPYGRIRSFREAGPALLEKLPFFALSAASSVITLAAQRERALWSVEALPLPARAASAATAIASYLHAMVLPLQLSPLYPQSGTSSFLRLEPLAAALAAALVTAACVRLVRRQKVWLAAWAYYLVTLLPVLGIIQVGYQSRADRYTYLPSLGPFLLAGLAVARLAGPAGAARARAVAIGLAGIAACGALSLLTVKQIGVWRDGVALWNAVIDRDPRGIPLAYNKRGRARERIGQLDGAIEDYSRAISLQPDYAGAYVNRGAVRFRKDLLDEAAADLDRAIALDPSLPEAYVNRALTFTAMRRYDLAIADYSSAISLQPGSAETYNRRGLAHGRNGAPGRALEDFSRAIELNPDFGDAYSNRGTAHALLGRPQDALGDLARAIRLDPGDAEAYVRRGRVHRRQGSEGAALADFRRACELGNADGCRAAQRSSPR